MCHCPEYQCPYCKKYAPGHNQRECLDRAVRMQTTRTRYAKRQAQPQCPPRTFHDDGPPEYDNKADYDDDVYTHENMDGER